MSELLAEVGYGDVMIQVDGDYTQRINLPLGRVVIADGRITITFPPGNTVADLAHAAIEVLDTVDGIEADKIVSIPDA